MNKVNFDNFFKNNKYVICPHCNQKLKKGSTFCSTCGFVLEESTKIEKKEELHFGRAELSTATSSIEIPDSEYAQQITKTTKVLKIDKKLPHVLYLNQIIKNQIWNVQLGEEDALLDASSIASYKRLLIPSLIINLSNIYI